jgi:hypothetical protein
MRSTALASKVDDDEVPVSSIEVLEMNVAAIRSDLNEFKNDFRTTVARIDNDVKAAVQRLEAQIRDMGIEFKAEIRATAENAKNGLEKLAVRLDTQLQELRADNKALREKVDRNLELMLAKFDETNRKIEQTNDLTNEKLGALDRKVTEIGIKLTALLWVIGGLGTLITIAITVGKALHWF